MIADGLVHMDLDPRREVGVVDHTENYIAFLLEIGSTEAEGFRHEGGRSTAF